MDCNKCLWYDPKAKIIHDASVECLLCSECKLPRTLKRNYYEKIFNPIQYVKDKQNNETKPEPEQTADSKRYEY